MGIEKPRREWRKKRLEWRTTSWLKRRFIAAATARVWHQAASYLVASWKPRARPVLGPGDKRHLLVLARHLPPTVNGGVYRPLALIEEADRRGWDVTALCSEPEPWHPKAGAELARRIPAACRVVHWKQELTDTDPRRIPHIDGDFESIASIVNAARDALGQRRPSLVFATGPTFAEFVAALALGDAYQVPYLLDYRDEWSESPFDFVFKGGSNRFWESRSLARASLVTFTTEAQRQHQIEKFPVLTRERSAVLQNGWDDHAASSSQREAPVERMGVPTLAFLGNLSTYISLPTFLATLREALVIRPGLVGRIRLLFVGMKDPAEKARLDTFPVGGMMESIDQVPLSEAQAIMRRSDSLLVFNPEWCARYITGKAFEYIATGRPILTYGEGGEIERLLAGYAASTIISRGDAAALATALERIASRAPFPPVDPAFIRGMSRTERSRAHLDLLEGVITQGSRRSEGASPRPS